MQKAVSCSLCNLPSHPALQHLGNTHVSIVASRPRLCELRCNFWAPNVKVQLLNHLEHSVENCLNVNPTVVQARDNSTVRVHAESKPVLSILSVCAGSYSRCHCNITVSDKTKQQGQKGKRNQTSEVIHTKTQRMTQD